jgi:hypothetical protein
MSPHPVDVHHVKQTMSESNVTNTIKNSTQSGMTLATDTPRVTPILLYLVVYVIYEYIYSHTVLRPFLQGSGLNTTGCYATDP